MAIKHNVMIGTAGTVPAPHPAPQTLGACVPGVFGNGSLQSGIPSPSESGETTVTVNEQVAVFIEESVAVHVTVVLPTGKNEPDAGGQTYRTLGQLSLTVGAG